MACCVVTVTRITHRSMLPSHNLGNLTGKMVPCETVAQQVTRFEETRPGFGCAPWHFLTSLSVYLCVAVSRRP